MTEICKKCTNNVSEEKSAKKKNTCIGKLMLRETCDKTLNSVLVAVCDA